MGIFDRWRQPRPSPTLRDQQKALDHVARHDLAIAQCETLVACGQKPSSRLDQLHRERAYWLALSRVNEMRV